MKIKHWKYFISCIIMMPSCISPVDNFEQITVKQFLTIDAALTDQATTHKVQLTYSVGDFNGNSFFAPVTKAKVFITDELNNREDFIEQKGKEEEGNYLSSAKFRGRVGGTYILNIETSEGKKYQSFPETMKAVPEIENLITRFETNDIYDRNDPRRASFNVYVNFQDPPTKGDNYQWNWKHYEKDSICKTCYGGSYDFKLKRCVDATAGVFPRTLSYVCDGNCWGISFSNDINILSDVYLNGQRITGRQVVKIPFSDYTPYYLQLEQRAINLNAFNYFQSLAVQTQSNGTLFDVPAETRFSYNIKSISNPEEKILGIFNVYSVRKKIFYINRREGVPNGELPVYSVLPGEVVKCLPQNPCPVPCIESPNRTKIKPEGWRE